MITFLNYSRLSQLCRCYNNATSMIVVGKTISKKVIRQMALKSFGNLVKAVVDISKKVMVVDAGLHADLEAMLLSSGSKPENLWGINIYPDLDGDDFIEFDSMINLKPGKGNMSRGVDDPTVRRKIEAIVNSLVK